MCVIFCGTLFRPSKSNRSRAENRWKLFGKTDTGRYLVVVFTIRRKLFRTVTAYEMNHPERRTYAPQID